MVTVPRFGAEPVRRSHSLRHLAGVGLTGSDEQSAYGLIGTRGLFCKRRQIRPAGESFDARTARQDLVLSMSRRASARPAWRLAVLALAGVGAIVAVTERAVAQTGVAQCNRHCLSGF